MAVDHRLQKLFGNFRGIDKRSSDLSRGSEFATEIKNAVYRSSGAISKRKGYHGTSGNNGGGHGLITYKNVDTTTGLITEELLCVDSELRKLISGTFTITYSGSGNAWYTMYLDETSKTFKFKILEDGVYILDYDLGTGIPDGVSLTDLKTQIDALAGFTSAIADVTASSKAAFLDTAEVTAISSGGTALSFNEWSAVTKGDSGAGFASYNLNLDDKELENMSFAQLNNVLYISNGYDEVMKYDGDKLYRAGLPKPAAPSLSNQGAGNVNGTYKYKIEYEFTDNKGNKITSVVSDEVEHSPSSQIVRVTCAFPSAGDGFNSTDADFKINVYRNQGSTAFYRIGTIVNGGNLYIDDNTATVSNSFDAFSEPLKRHDPPPKGRYLSVVQDCLVISGQRTNVNNIQYSLGYNAASLEIGSEYFPDDDNGIIVESKFGDKITAIAPLKDVLYIFHTNSIHTLSGQLITDSYKVDLLTTEGGIGCESHNSIQEFQGNLFFLSQNGIYSINNSQGFPTEVSAPIQPLFKNLTSNHNKRKAIAFNWVKENVLLFIIPKESTGTSDVLYTADNSKIFVYDTSRQAWLEWDTIDFSGGISLKEDVVYFSSRDVDGSTNKISYLYKMQDNSSTYDYTDHNAAINFTYKTNWESLQEPTLPKKFLRLKMYAMDSDETFESSSFSLSVKVQRNYIKDDVGTLVMDFAGLSGGGWGVAPWGTSTWGSNILQGLKTKLPSGKTRSLLLNFENNNANENVLISGYEMEIATPYRTEIKE